MQHIDLYNLWKERAVSDTDIVKELDDIKNDYDGIFDRFYKELSFGTGGLRGVIGAGTNRMNIYTVGKATQGFAEYINKTSENGRVAIAYDSRIKSNLFAKKAASVFAANGIKVFIYKELMPTPMLSFAVRELKCDAGIVVTASHNPSKYNGYKAYGPDGCQLTLEASESVLSYINKVDTFDGVKSIDFEDGIASGKINYIDDEIIEKYLDAVKARAIHPELCDGSDFKVIYTPLHGTGNKPVRAILKKIGLENVMVVPSQELPDGNFPSAPYPNPEIKEAFREALELTNSYDADILLATDPDCDRVGIAVKTSDGYSLMNGNEVGTMLLNYILSERSANGTLPELPVAVKTIVTTNMPEKIAAKYNCRLENVLTGFKFIGEIIGQLENKGEAERYVFGFEESYGYLSGSYVRDKDGVVASMLICEMACFYKKQGLTLKDVMNRLYEEYGYYRTGLASFVCEGASGMERMNEIMEGFRNDIPNDIGGIKVVALSDYTTSKTTYTEIGKAEEITLPKSNVLQFKLSGGSLVTVRPSGTEPKIKVYVEAIEETAENSEKLYEALMSDISRKMGF